MAATMSSMGLGLGGLGVQDAGLQTQAAIGAGQLESFARNAWAEILARLMGGGGSRSGDGLSIEDRGLDPDGDGFLALRDGTSSGARRLAKMPEGTLLQVLSQGNPWWYVRTGNGIEGYAHSRWIGCWSMLLLAILIISWNMY